MGASVVDRQKQTLFRRHPRRLDVPIMLIAAMGLLAAGLSMPTLKLTKVIFFTDTYSIWAGIVELWKSELYLIAAVIFFFSLVFPIFKLAALTGIWFTPMSDIFRGRMLAWLETLGRWSMLDVYVVAVLIVLVKAKTVADAEAGIGIYLFAAAIILSMLATQAIRRLAGERPT